MTRGARTLLWAGAAAALAAGLALWWRWGLPVAMADGTWLCLTWG